MANPFDQFDNQKSTNPFDQFDTEKKEKSGFLSNVVGGIAEPLMALASGMVAKPLSDVAGLAAMGGNMIGGMNGDPTAFKRHVQESLTYSPRTDAGKAIAESPYNPLNAIGNVVNSASSGAANVVRGDNPGMLRDAAGNLVQEAIPQALGFVGVKGAKSGLPAIDAMESASNAALASKASRAAPLMQTLQEGLDAGLVVPPSSVNPSFANTMKESIGGKIATAQEASNRNAPVFDDLARKSIGLPADAPITPQATQAIRKQAYQTGYAPIEQFGVMPTDAKFTSDLNSLVAKHQGAARSFPNLVNDEALNIVNSLKVRDFDAGDALKATQYLRDQAGANFAKGESAAAQVQKGAAKAIEDQIERGLSASGNIDALKRFKEARQLMAKAHTVEDSLIAGSGSVNPASFAKRAQEGKYLSDEQAIIGNFANNFRKASQPASQVAGPGVSKLNSAFAVAGGGGGAALFGPVGAAIGAAAPFVVPPILRSQLLSRGTQNSLLELYAMGLPEKAKYNALRTLLAGSAVALNQGDRE